jgi:Ca2+-transporting ATPase
MEGKMTESEEIPWHRLTVEETLSRLGTRYEGLTSEEARQRLEVFGPNELPTQERPLALQILIRQIQSPLIYVLFVAAAVSMLLAKYVDAAVILAVIVLNTVVGFIQEYKAEQAMRALARLTASRARVLRDGVDCEIDPKEIVPGDIVLLEPGFKVPADLRIFRATDLAADESVLTGESVPIAKTTEPVADPQAPLGDQRDLAFMGTVITRGRGAGIVVATGIHTAFGHISTQVREVGEVQSPLLVRLSRFASIIALGVLGITAIVFVLGFLRGENVADIFLTAIATAVATVPEGLPVTITVALAVGAWRMARRNAIVRKLPAVETLGSCTVICSDKTGTLTKNEMTVTRIVACATVFEVTGVGYAPEGEIRLAGQRVSLESYPALAMTLRIGLLCNDSSVYREDGRYRVDGDPTEGALIVAALKGGLDEEYERDTYRTVDEIPFESTRQYMATLHRRNAEGYIFVKGAPERVLDMCAATYTGDGPAPLDREAVLRQFHRLAEEGLRVLAMAYRTAPRSATQLRSSDVETGLIFVGLEGMLDPPRPEAIPAVANCRRAGVRVVMITGDHPVTARAIAAKIGIVRDPHARVIVGREMEAMTDEELFTDVMLAPIFARIAPDQKLRIVQQLQRHGEVVAATGDGVNDAPALKQADIGVAMGITGTDVAKEAADMVLADDNFATIYAAIVEGRVVYDNIRKVILFLIPTGFGLVLTVIGSMILGLPLPFLPAQAIWINLVTNGTQDVAMAFEPPEEDVGRRPPRNPREGIMTRLMIDRTILVGAVLLVGTLGTFVWQLGSGSDLEHARTVAMTTMVLFQNIHVFNSRSFTRSAFSMNPLTNRFLFVSIVAALGLHILAVYWPPLEFVLRTVPLALDTWFIILVVALSVLVVVEVDKATRRRRSRAESS